MSKIRKAQKGTKFPGPPTGLRGMYPSKKAVAKTIAEAKKSFEESSAPKVTLKWKNSMNKQDSTIMDTSGYSAGRKYFPTKNSKWAPRGMAKAAIRQSQKKTGGTVRKTSKRK